LISTSSGIMIRMAAGSIRVSGRATQGVKVIRLDDQDSIADIAVVKNTGEEAEEAVIEPIMPEEMNLDILPDDFSTEEE